MIRVRAALFLGFAAGCSNMPTSTAYPPLIPQVTEAIATIPARVPAGVARYCWEEPIVELEPNGPGLDVEGRWYHPSYIAVREVRSGKWRPCVPTSDEVKRGNSSISGGDNPEPD